MKSSFRLIALAVAGLAMPALAGAADVQENWTKQCAKCHAADGTGTTTIGKKLKLRSYADPAFQAELKDDEMIRITKEGVKDAAGKSQMPAYADKLTDEEIVALVAHIRSFKKG